MENMLYLTSFLPSFSNVTVLSDDDVPCRASGLGGGGGRYWSGRGVDNIGLGGGTVGG